MCCTADTATAAPTLDQHHLVFRTWNISAHNLILILATLDYRRYAAMDRDEALMIAYEKSFNEARAFYEDDEYENAVEVAESMLHDSELPRFHRIKIFCLIAACLGDNSEADDFMEKAESEWSMGRWYVATRGMLVPFLPSHSCRANS